MNTLKEQYLTLALEYAKANEEIFETTSLNKRKRSQNVNKTLVMKKKIDKVYIEAEKNNELQEITEYMYHPNKYVRCITAAYCLSIDTQTALSILQELRKLPPPNPVGMHAFTIMHAWERGL